MLNKIQEFIDSQGISRYRFWKDTGLGRDTAYRLCNDPTYVPTGNVLNKICEAYRVQPGEFLVWSPDTSVDESASGNPQGTDSEPTAKRTKSTKSIAKTNSRQLAKLTA